MTCAICILILTVGLLGILIISALYNISGTLCNIYQSMLKKEDIKQSQPFSSSTQTICQRPQRECVTNYFNENCKDCGFNKECEKLIRKTNIHGNAVTPCDVINNKTMKDKYDNIIKTKPLFDFLKVGIGNAKYCIKTAEASFCPDKERIMRYKERLVAYNHIWQYLEQTLGIQKEEQNESN